MSGAPSLNATMSDVGCDAPVYADQVLPELLLSEEVERGCFEVLPACVLSRFKAAVVRHFAPLSTDVRNIHHYCYTTNKASPSPYTKITMDQVRVYRNSIEWEQGDVTHFPLLVLENIKSTPDLLITLQKLLGESRPVVNPAKLQAAVAEYQHVTRLMHGHIMSETVIACEGFQSRLVELHRHVADAERALLTIDPLRFHQSYSELGRREFARQEAEHRRRLVRLRQLAALSPEQREAALAKEQQRKRSAHYAFRMAHGAGNRSDGDD